MQYFNFFYIFLLFNQIRHDTFLHFSNKSTHGYAQSKETERHSQYIKLIESSLFETLSWHIKISHCFSSFKPLDRLIYFLIQHKHRFAPRSCVHLI